MKVAVLHNLQRGGAHRRLREQLRHLDADIVEVCLATALPTTDAPRVVGLRQRADDAQPALRPPLRYLDLAALLAAWRTAGRLVRDSGADVLYANPCRYLQTPPGLLVAGLPPTVYFCDEPRRVDYEPDADAMRNPRTRALYAPLYAAQRRLDRRAVAQPARVLTNSRYTAGTIASAYGRAAEPIPMGVPDALLHCERAPEPRHLLSVGMLIPTKGHDLVIRAAASLAPTWPLLIVAPRPAPEEEARLRRLARDLAVELDVRVGISDEELQEAYGAAVATLYLARGEPLGLVSLEAQACGCPVIVADEGGLPETVQDGRSGFVVTRSPEAAARALRELADPARRASMSAAAREHAAGWTWAVSARRVREQLEGVTA
jgi:glycosyltransferase involved in cell wall biosynthesis